MHIVTTLQAAFDPGKVSWTAAAIAFTTAVAILALIALFSGVSIFGPINDLANAVVGLLAAILAWQFTALLSEHSPGLAILFLLAAWTGSAAIISNSILVAFGRMDWMAGSLYTALGYGLLGVWLLALVRLGGPQDFLTPGMVKLGTITAAGMLTGLLALPLLITNLGGLTGAKNLLAGISYLGILAGYSLFPVWCWRIDRILAAF